MHASPQGFTTLHQILVSRAIDISEFFTQISPKMLGIKPLWAKSPSFSAIFTRTLMKTHKGAAKRWIKTAKGYKRGKPGRKHGNAGWSQRLLQSKDGKTEALGKGHGDHKKRLKVLLPYA